MTSQTLEHSLELSVASQKAAIVHGLKIAVFSLGFVVVAANLAVGTYFQTRLMPGVKVAGIDLGGIDKTTAARLIEQAARSYRVGVTAGEKRYSLRPEEFGTSYDAPATLESAWSEGRGHWLALYGLFEPKSEVRFAYTVNQPAFDAAVKRIAEANSLAPTDAAIEVVSGQPQIKPEVAGKGIDQKHLANALYQAAVYQQASVDLGIETLTAQVRAVDLGPSIDAVKKLVATKLALTYKDKSFSPDAATIGGWLSFSKAADGSVKLKPNVEASKVQRYVEGLASSVYVAPKNKLINMVNGQVTGTEEGQEGTALDQAKVVSWLVSSAGSGQPGKFELPTLPVGFKTVYNRTINLDFGRYIEVNLSTQHLWAYQDHQVVFDSPITSGATGAGFPTVQGLFSIYGKERDRYLNGRPLGYNYNVFVQYWMPFYADYGLHDASWRSQFGGSDYYYNGSHGCVNLPLATAAWVYGWADVGTPVWVHS